MLILLLTFLAVAIVIIGLGLTVALKSQRSTTRRMMYAGRAVRRSDYSDSVRSMETNRQRSMRRSVLASVEPQPFCQVWALMDIRNTFAIRAGMHTPWLGIALVLLAVCLCGVALSRSFLPGSVTVDEMWPDATVPATGPALPPHGSFTFQGVVGASQALVRINQLDPGQYNSGQEQQTWSPSTCSAASMTEVINAYNAYYKIDKHYRITDVLKVEVAVHAISSDLGLLEPTGIDRTVRQFGFKTVWLNKPTIKDLINVANSGRPIIVNFPPDRWSGGHLLIVRGGDSQYVALADSSQLNMQMMLYATFLKYWAGFAVVVVPASQ